MIKKILNKILKIDWKKSVFIESPEGHWEILKIKNKFNLLYVPEDDYSEKDIIINITEEELEDLINLIKKLKR
jgi:hypothetical protein